MQSFSPSARSAAASFCAVSLSFFAAVRCAIFCSCSPRAALPPGYRGGSVSAAAGCGRRRAAGCGAGSRGRKSPWNPHRRPRTPHAPAADTRARKSRECRRGAKTDPVPRPAPCADSRSAAAHPRRPRAGAMCRRGSQRPPAAVFPSAWRAAADPRPYTPRPAPCPLRARRARSGAFARSGARRSRPYKTYSRAPSAAARPARAGRQGPSETARPLPSSGHTASTGASSCACIDAASSARPLAGRPEMRAGSRPLSSKDGRAAASVSPNSCPACATKNKTAPALWKNEKISVFLSYHNLHRKTIPRLRQILHLFI